MTDLTEDQARTAIAPWYSLFNIASRGIAHQRPDAFGEFFVLRADLRVIDGVVQIESRRQSLLIFRQRIVHDAEALRIEQIRHANPAAPNLVFVTRPMPRDVVPIGMRFSRASDIFSTSR